MLNRGKDDMDYERVERHEVWIDLRTVNLMWQVLEKTKKISQLHLLVYIIDMSRKCFHVKLK